MDFATIAGLVLGLAIVAVSLVLGGVPLDTILQPEAILIIFGGTLASLLINFSFEDIQNAVGNLRYAFREQDIFPQEIVEYITDAAIYIRTKGLLAIQPLLNQVDIPFLRKGLMLVVDNHPVEDIKAQLTIDMETQYRAQVRYARVFEAAGGFAPTMGIIGAIIGLTQIMGSFDSPDKMGHGVANAFIATLYGVGIANLFLLPLAGKLKQRAKSDWLLKSMMLEGILAIRAEENPSLIREKLQAYILPEEAHDGRAFEAYDDTLEPAGMIVP